MFLREIFNLIGLNKLQQVILIKILFLTGSLGLIEPSSLSDVKETIRINEEFLSSEIPEVLIFEKHFTIISQEKAEKILEVAEFESKEKAYHWLNSVLQKNFNSQSSKFLNDSFFTKYSADLKSLLHQFYLAGKIQKKQFFDHVIIIGNTEDNLHHTLSSAKNLLENYQISAAKTYFIFSSDQKLHRKKNSLLLSTSKIFPTNTPIIIETQNQNLSSEKQIYQYAQAWLEKTKPKLLNKKVTQNVLLVSGQFFPNYQLAVFKSLLPKNFDFYLANITSEDQENIALTLKNFSIELELFKDLILKK